MPNQTERGGHKQIPTRRRKELVVHNIQVYGTTSPTQLQQLIKTQTGKTVHRQTIKNDVDDIIRNNQQWVNDQAKAAWSEKIKQMYIETNLEIIELQKDIDEIRKHNIEYYKDIEVNEESQEKLYELINQVARIKTGGKIAYINSIITEKRNFLISMMTDKPLYEKTQELAQYYEQHKPQEVQ